VRFGYYYTKKYTPIKHDGFNSMLNLYTTVWKAGIQEVAVLGVTQACIWMLVQVGFFDWLIEAVPMQHFRTPVVFLQMHGLISNAVGVVEPMHLPGSGDDLAYTLRCVNIHLFLGLVFYYIMMYHVVYSSVRLFSVFMQAEDMPGYELYHKVHKTDAAEDLHAFFHGASESPRSGDRMRSMNTGILEKSVRAINSTQIKWVGANLNTEEHFVNMRRYFINHVARRTDLCEYLMEHLNMNRDELDATLDRIKLYRYLSSHLRKRIRLLIKFDYKVWIGFVMVLMVDVLIHYFLKIAFIHLMKYYIAFAFVCQAYEIAVARRRLMHVIDEANVSEQLTKEESEGRSYYQMHSVDTWFVLVHQLLFILICYSGARVAASQFFWTDYFWDSVIITTVLFMWYIFHILVGSVWIPLYMIVYTLPPYISDEEKDTLVKALKEVNKQHQGEDGVKSIPF